MAASNKKVIKPLNPSEVDFDNIVYGAVKVNSEIGTKWVDITYKNESKQFLTVVRGCVVKSFKKREFKEKEGSEKNSNKKEGKPRADKYDFFIAIKDEQFIEFQKKLNENVIDEAIKNSVSWFGDALSDEDCRAMNKSFLIYNEKYKSYALGCSITKDFVCKNKVNPSADCTNLLEALQKNVIIDICLNYNKVKLSTDNYRIDAVITQANIVGEADTTEYASTAVTSSEFVSGKIRLGPREENENHGKFCKVFYDDKPLRLRFVGVKGRMIRFEKDDVVTHSLSVKLSDAENFNMIKSIDKEIFDKLFANQKDYYDTKKTAKLLERSINTLVSYSKDDKERIAKGEKPQYDPSVWIKIYYSAEKGFDNKIKNSADGSPLNNPEELLNKDLDITELEVYSRHIWFGPKGTSVNLTLNKCSIMQQTLSYDMDDVADGDDEVQEEEDSVEEAGDSSSDE